MPNFLGSLESTSNAVLNLWEIIDLFGQQLLNRFRWGYGSQACQPSNVDCLEYTEELRVPQAPRFQKTTKTRLKTQSLSQSSWYWTLVAVLSALISPFSHA